MAGRHCYILSRSRCGKAASALQLPSATSSAAQSHLQTTNPDFVKSALELTHLIDYTILILRGACAAREHSLENGRRSLEFRVFSLELLCFTKLPNFKLSTLNFKLTIPAGRLSM